MTSVKVALHCNDDDDDGDADKPRRDYIISAAV